MADQMTNEVIDQETAEAQMVEVVQPAIEKLIYVIRDKQVMIDSDLAMLYHVETKRLNEAVKRNIARFPEEFRFQLTEKETESLRSQIATSMKSNGDNEKKGGRRYLPYAFTEQGIAMLSAVLRSDVAIQVSINIMNAFVEMRRFIANNSLLFESFYRFRAFSDSPAHGQASSPFVFPVHHWTVPVLQARTTDRSSIFLCQAYEAMPAVLLFLLCRKMSVPHTLFPVLPGFPAAHKLSSFLIFFQSDIRQKFQDNNIPVLTRIPTCSHQFYHP